MIRMCFNINVHIPGQRYVYLLIRKFEKIPIKDSWEDTLHIMHKFFEYGVINLHPLMNLLDQISLIYIPLCERQNETLTSENILGQLVRNELENAKANFVEALQEFFDHADIIVDHLKESFPFKLPHIPVDSTPEELALDPQFVSEAGNCLEQWNGILEEKLSSLSKKKPVQKNPFSELAFWEEQLSDIGNLADHLSSHSLRIVLRVLEITECKGLEKFEIQSSHISKHLFVARDNLNYLKNLEPYLMDLLPDAPLQSAIKALPPLMNIHKLLWTLSDYYGQAENMGRLIEGMAFVVEKKIKNAAGVKTLFDKNFVDIQEITKLCCTLADEWKDSYSKQRTDIETYEGLQHWYFSTKILFKRSEYLSRVCMDLNNLAEKAMLLHNILKPQLKMLCPEPATYKVLEEKISELPKRIKYVDFDIFSVKHYVLWANLVHWFEKQCNEIEADAQSLIAKILEEQENFETAILFIHSFEETNVSESIRKVVKEKSESVVFRYKKEVKRVDHEFMLHKHSPPQYSGFPKLTSAIIWSRHLLGRIKTPILIFQKNKEFFNSEKGQEIQHFYLRTAKVLKKFEVEIFEDWVRNDCENISAILQGPLFRKGDVNPFFYDLNLLKEFKNMFTGTRLPEMNYIVNFPHDLDTIMVNAGFLTHMGFKLPMEVLNFVVQGENYCNMVKELNIVLFKLHSSLGSLDIPEAMLLQNQLEVVFEEVEPGFQNMTWSSLGLPQFIAKISRAIDFFGSIVHQIHQVGKEIDAKILSLKHAKLLHFKRYNEGDVSMCQLFFEDAERQMDAEMRKYVAVYHSILPLLYKLESLACGTYTGKSPYMETYYRFCEIKISCALAEMVIENLDVLQHSLSSHIFPFFLSVFKSKDQLVAASVVKSFESFKMFVQNCVKSTVKFRRWMDGTCIEAMPALGQDSVEPWEYTYYLDVKLHPKVWKLVKDISGQVQTFININHQQV